jgi:PmbA protein
MQIAEKSLGLLADLIGRVTRAGADGADAVFVEGISLSLSQRLGEPESVERSEAADVGLRAFIGKRQAIVSSSDTSPDALDEMVERAVAMARAVPEDPHCGLADEGLLASRFPDLDICELDEPTPETLADRAGQAEDAARAVPGVTNSEGAEATWGLSTVAMAASNGFAGAYSRSRHGLGVSVLAGEGTAMERDYDFATAVFSGDLDLGEDVGRRAGEKAVARLNPRKIASAKVPVIYDPRVSRSLLGHLAGAINGSSVARGTSFLKDKLGQHIFPDSITIVDDPLRPRGLRSRPFDAEGLAAERRSIVDAGRLTTWIMDLRSARQLGMASTAHASRGTSSPPSPSASNLYLEPGPSSPEDLIAGTESGFYVTELIGFGVDGLTGDYSRGACGQWIENGEFAYPVSEVTVAGNLAAMFANITAASDLEFRAGTNAPTVRVDGMTVAGV